VSHFRDPLCYSLNRLIVQRSNADTSSPIAPITVIGLRYNKRDSEKMPRETSKFDDISQKFMFIKSVKYQRKLSIIVSQYQSYQY